MAETPSNMLPLQTLAPDFTLLDTKDRQVKTLKQLQSDKATVIFFICNHCPYVLHILPKLIEVAHIYQAQGVSFIAISANDVIHYPQDGPKAMHDLAKQNLFPFPYLYDETQMVAKAYQAACTPDFYLFDHALKCVYRGRFDASTPGNQEPITGKDLTRAMDQLLTGDAITNEQYPSVGCNIKWKK